MTSLPSMAAREGRGSVMIKQPRQSRKLLPLPSDPLPLLHQSEQSAKSAVKLPSCVFLPPTSVLPHFSVTKSSTANSTNDPGTPMNLITPFLSNT